MKHNLVEISAILVGFATVIALIMTLEKSNEIQKTDVYQRLEFASIDLFRFEIEQTDKTWRLYDPKFNIEMDTTILNPTSDVLTQEAMEMINHITQLLNLFGMSVELHNKGIIHDEHFAPWIKWIYFITSLESFKILWYGAELGEHYKEDLKELIIISHDSANFDAFTESVCELKYYKKMKKYLPNYEEDGRNFLFKKKYKLNSQK